MSFYIVQALAGLLLVVFADGVRRFEVKLEERYGSNSLYHKDRLQQLMNRRTSWLYRILGLVALVAGVLLWLRSR